MKFLNTIVFLSVLLFCSSCDESEQTQQKRLREEQKRKQIQEEIYRKGEEVRNFRENYRVPQQNITQKEKQSSREPVLSPFLTEREKKAAGGKPANVLPMPVHINNPNKVSIGTTGIDNVK